VSSQRGFAGRLKALAPVAQVWKQVATHLQHLVDAVASVCRIRTCLAIRLCYCARGFYSVYFGGVYIPSIFVTLFKPSKHWCAWQPLNAQLEQPTVPPDAALKEKCDSQRELYVMDELEWSEGEPAINIYQECFGCHKDHLALTILIPLTSPLEFSRWWH